jgi:hypothetical protein
MRTQFLLIALAVFLFVGGPAFAQGPCSSQSSKLACVIPQEYGVSGTGGNQTFNFGEILYLAPNPVSGKNFHPSHFVSEFGTQLGPLTSAIGRQANLLPLASPSSGVLLTYDPSLKTFAVITDSSLGPILGERGETVGRHKLFVGFSAQFFDFDKIDGVNLRTIPAVLTHTDDGADNSTPNSTPPVFNTCSIANGKDLHGCAFVRDAFYSQNSIDLKINQYTGYITFGLSSHVDVSMVIPFERVRMSLYTQSSIVLGSDGSFTPLGGPACAITDPSYNSCSPDSLILNQRVTGTNGAPYFFHLFQDCQDTSPAAGAAGLAPNCLHHSFPDPSWTGSGSSAVNSSSGIGDIVARVKWNALSGERLKFASGVDVRFPTGDALNYLGSGAYGVKPFAILSYRARVSPHAMVGYEWNSNSILSSRINEVPPSFPGGQPQASIGLLTGKKGYMPSEFLYTAGVDAWITKWLTGSFDVVGARILRGGTEAVTSQSFPAPCSAGCLTEPSPSTVSSSSLAPNNDASYSVTNASMGVKIRPIPKVSKLVLTANVLVRLDSGGLHSKPAPLVGLGYTF